MQALVSFPFNFPRHDNSQVTSRQVAAAWPQHTHLWSLWKCRLKGQVFTAKVPLSPVYGSMIEISKIPAGNARKTLAIRHSPEGRAAQQDPFLKYSRPPRGHALSLAQGHRFQLHQAEQWLSHTGASGHLPFHPSWVHLGTVSSRALQGLAKWLSSTRCDYWKLSS